MDIHEFNDLFRAGDEYATFLLCNNILWFDRGTISLTVQGQG